jgi:hypothetical protein
MPISIGIICESCGIVYLITARAHIALQPRTADPGVFTLSCSCGATRPFHKTDLRPYTVSTQVLARGFAIPGQYNEQHDGAPLRKPRADRKG